jgi:hypothetical protein
MKYWKAEKMRFLPVGFSFVVINDNWQVQIDEEMYFYNFSSGFISNGKGRRR